MLNFDEEAEACESFVPLLVANAIDSDQLLVIADSVHCSNSLLRSRVVEVDLSAHLVQESGPVEAGALGAPLHKLDGSFFSIEVDRLRVESVQAMTVEEWRVHLC